MSQSIPGVNTDVDVADVNGLDAALQSAIDAALANVVFSVIDGNGFESEEFDIIDGNAL